MEDSHTHAEVQDFFNKDWKTFFQTISGEILVVGNPPWVTNSSLSVLGGKNLPPKNNFQNHKGFAAKTGKANFDISEWILIKILESMGKHQGCLAMLCKTNTARKVLKHVWLRNYPVGKISIHHIDAKNHFDVAVDACLLIVHSGISEKYQTAKVYGDLSFESHLNTIGIHGKELVADFDGYLKIRHLDGRSPYKWRSGAKHDSARIMEFTRDGNRLINGIGEFVNLEEKYLYPLLKSSDLANGTLKPTRLVLLTQRRPGDNTSHIKTDAPSTWKYLIAHADVLDARKSIIYKKRPRFSVFGIGDYSFAPWKVAISALYKTLQFQVIGSYGEKPIIVDDTCCFIPCRTEEEAQFYCGLLNSEVSRRFLCSLIFFDAKRPITIDILNRIDFGKLSKSLGLDHQYDALSSGIQKLGFQQLPLCFGQK